jgi:hypothetical protein
VSDLADDSDLEARLAELADALDLVDDPRLADGVLARLDEPVAAATAPWLRVAAAVVAIVAISAVLLPGPRRTVAGWFGFDNATIERRPDLVTPDEVPDAEPLPGVRDRSDVSLPDGVVLSELDGALDDALLAKSLGPDSSIVEIDVDGHRGLWIDGSPHLLVVRGGDGAIVTRRFAGNTLLWQVGDTLYRLEGADTAAAAVAVAAAITP